MTATNKTELLKTMEQRVERHLTEAIKDFQNRNEEELNMLSATGGWSIAQCLDHLNSYGHFYLPEIKKALNVAGTLSSDKTFKSSWLGNYFIRMMDPETGKKKYKAFKGHIPKSDLRASEVVAEFIKQQEELLSYLRKAIDKDLNVKLPVSITKLIRLKLGDVFQFLIAHNERHMQQAKRNLLPQEAKNPQATN